MEQAAQAQPETVVKLASTVTAGASAAGPKSKLVRPMLPKLACTGAKAMTWAVAVMSAATPVVSPAADARTAVRPSSASAAPFVRSPRVTA